MASDDRKTLKSTFAKQVAAEKHADDNVINLRPKQKPGQRLSNPRDAVTGQPRINRALTNVKAIRTELGWMYNRVKNAIMSMESARVLVPTDYYRSAVIILKEAKECIIDQETASKLDKLARAVQAIERGDGKKSKDVAAVAAGLPLASVTDDIELED